jgi:glycosyltransferase involved in cell wall biosynthesis
MCVYNGERYLKDQLESILGQTLPPDEVNIYDDCSTDSTISLIHSFIIKNNLKNWHITINPYNKGWRLNFYDALSNCNGDYIFFCDQDDIWYPDKISTMVNIIRENPQILVLSGLQHTIDSNNKIIDNNNIETINMKNSFDRTINKSDLYDNIVNFQNRIGAAMLIRKIIKEQLLFFDRNNLFAHDLWAVNISSMMGGCYWFNSPVIRYRIHDNNASVTINIKKRNKKERITQLENKYKYCLYLYNSIKKIDASLLLKSECDKLSRCVKLFKIKLSIIKKQRFYLWFLLFPYFDIFIKYLSVKYILIELLESLNMRDSYQSMKARLIKPK